MAASIDSFFMLEALSRLDGGMSQLVEVSRDSVVCPACFHCSSSAAALPWLLRTFSLLTAVVIAQLGLHAAGLQSQSVL